MCYKYIRKWMVVLPRICPWTSTLFQATIHFTDTYQFLSSNSSLQKLRDLKPLESYAKIHQQQSYVLIVGRGSNIMAGVNLLLEGNKCVLQKKQSWDYKVSKWNKVIIYFELKSCTCNFSHLSLYMSYLIYQYAYGISLCTYRISLCTTYM
jgi:hypothetical protein